jgi:hypothetical protein
MTDAEAFEVWRRGVLAAGYQFVATAPSKGGFLVSIEGPGQSGMPLFFAASARIAPLLEREIANGLVELLNCKE